MSRVSPVVQLSIDLGLRSHQTALLQHQQFETVSQNLFAWISEYQLPATWAVAFPADNGLVPTLLRLDVPQEIALLANRSWADASIGRGTFARELSQRMNDAKHRGIKITSLASCDTDVNENFDLIAKQQLSIVRVGVLRGGRSRTVESVRHGVWRVKPTMSFPVKGSIARLNWALTQSRLSRGSKRGAIQHVRIAAADLLEANRSTWRSLDQFLRRVSKLRDAGQIRMQTLRGLAQQMHPPRIQEPSRSILRRAA